MEIMFRVLEIEQRSNQCNGPREPNPFEVASTGQCGSSVVKSLLNGSRTAVSQKSSLRIPGASSGEGEPMFAMDGVVTNVMTNMMTGGLGAPVFLGLMCCVTKRIQPTGLVQRTPIWTPIWTPI
jgi:hypothetical protein